MPCGVLRRSSAELRGTPTLLGSIPMTAVSVELLRVHAFLRRVSYSAFVSDLLNGWLSACTDFADPAVSHVTPKGMRAPDVPERWIGYLASLGFVPAKPQDPASDLPVGVRDLSGPSGDPADAGAVVRWGR